MCPGGDTTEDLLPQRVYIPFLTKLGLRWEIQQPIITGSGDSLQSLLWSSNSKTMCRCHADDKGERRCFGVVRVAMTRDVSILSSSV